jgi:hypothetical protein
MGVDVQRFGEKLCPWGGTPCCECCDKNPFPVTGAPVFCRAWRAWTKYETWTKGTKSEKGNRGKVGR